MGHVRGGNQKLCNSLQDTEKGRGVVKKPEWETFEKDKFA